MMKQNQSMPVVKLFMSLLFFLGGCAFAPSSPAEQTALPSETVPVREDGSFSGQAITVLTYDGPQIAEPLKRRAREFQARTGAEVTVQTVPFGNLYEEILTDFQREMKHYDVVVFAPQWMADYVNQGYIEDLTTRIQPGLSYGLVGRQRLSPDPGDPAGSIL